MTDKIPIENSFEKHTQSAAMVVWRYNSQVGVVQFLLVKESRTHHLTGATGIMYNQPVGRIEEGETPEQAAIRELEEETGYQPRGDVEFLGQYSQDFGSEIVTRHCFYCQVTNNALSLPSDTNVIGTVWVSLYAMKLLPLRNDMVLKCTEDFLNLISSSNG